MQPLKECVLLGPRGDVMKQRCHYLSKGCPIQGSTSRVHNAVTKTMTYGLLMIARHLLR